MVSVRICDKVISDIRVECRMSSKVVVLESGKDIPCSINLEKSLPWSDADCDLTFSTPASACRSDPAQPRGGPARVQKI